MRFMYVINLVSKYFIRYLCKSTHSYNQIGSHHSTRTEFLNSAEIATEKRKLKPNVKSQEAPLAHQSSYYMKEAKLRSRCYACKKVFELDGRMKRGKNIQQPKAS